MTPIMPLNPGTAIDRLQNALAVLTAMVDTHDAYIASLTDLMPEETKDFYKHGDPLIEAARTVLSDNA